MLENFILAIFFPAISLQFTANYCNSKLCGYTDAHTLCQYKRGPGPDCAGYIAVNLTDEDVLRIVERLNRRRSDIASGRGRMPPAGNMLKLRWVDELAREAQIWADQCRRPKMPEEHDLCRDLYSIQVGQCVASVTGDAPGIRPESMVDMWYLQSHYYKANVVSYVSPNNTTKYYGDFAQFIWAKTYMVGCGRSRFMVPFDGRFRSVERLVCNFAPRGPVPGRPLWTTAPPATACPARSQPDYEFPALCTHNYAIDEPYDMHGSLTLDEHRALSSLIILEQDRSAGVQRSLDDIFMSKLNMEKPLYLRKRSAENVTEVNTLASSAVKENLVGRPKSYELEELNDANSHKVENETQFDFPTTTKGKDYEDYILFENGEDFNVSIDHNDDVNNGTKHENDEDENSNAHERSYQNATILSELSKLTNYLIDIDQNQSSENVSRTKSESDNLSERFILIR